MANGNRVVMALLNLLLDLLTSLFNALRTGKTPEPQAEATGPAPAGRPARAPAPRTYSPHRTRHARTAPVSQPVAPRLPMHAYAASRILHPAALALPPRRDSAAPKVRR